VGIDLGGAAREGMKIHIIGIAGSGKTTLARWISRVFEIPAFDLDNVVYGVDGGERPAGEIVRRVDEIRAGNGWVTEGAYRNEWLRPLLDDATAIVWLDSSLATDVARMLKRHARAELSGINPHPGWRRLIRFLDYNRRTAREQRAETSALLARYASKVFRCGASRDVESFKARIREQLSSDDPTA
jgi:adenylate kinase family enzyme